MSSDVSKPPAQSKVSDDFDRISEGYERQIDDAVAFSGFTTDFFIKVKCDYLERLMKRHLGTLDADVLDLGCGVGNYHRHLSGKFRTLTGIDVSERSIAIARTRGVAATYDVYPGGRLPYDDRRFDVVFTSCVMHHVPVGGWGEFTAEMYRVVRPGGLVVVFEHNPANPLTRRIVDNCPIDEDAVLLKARTTMDLFRGAGLDVLGHRAILSIPPVLPLLYALDEGLGRIGIGAQYYVAGTRPAEPERIA